MQLLVSHRYSSRKHRLFKDMGIPGPKPVFLLGNLMWWVKKVSEHNEFKHRTSNDAYNASYGFVKILEIRNYPIEKQISGISIHNFLTNQPCHFSLYHTPRIILTKSLEYLKISLVTTVSQSAFIMGS